jgi:hypothetical protein
MGAARLAPALVAIKFVGIYVGINIFLRKIIFYNQIDKTIIRCRPGTKKRSVNLSFVDVSGRALKEIRLINDNRIQSAAAL